ncbi:MAG TPA: cation diffusion facilitator family transporter [Agitococcus sp.]|nr:cation diffusion facilitator family transporter [Agitococcus sp.]
MSQANLTRYAWLSIATAFFTLGLKIVAYWMTNSVGMLSDAIESIVNVGAAVMALTMLNIAARPADDDHAFGHSKAEYFSSGFEGALIFVAAISIIGAAWPRLFNPQPIEAFNWGFAISILASVFNFITAFILFKAAKKYNSITLEADAHHLMTDVWTSIGVLIAIVAVALTGWYVLDALIAIGVALNILWTGWSLLYRSVAGLMDAALPHAEVQQIKQILDNYSHEHGIIYQNLKTRQAGARKFISVHILVNGNWSVQQGHDLVDIIETDIEQKISGCHVLTHLEPIEAPSKHHF